jgi:hypothetical protein
MVRSASNTVRGLMTDKQAHCVKFETLSSNLDAASQHRISQRLSWKKEK